MAGPESWGTPVGDQGNKVSEDKEREAAREEMRFSQSAHAFFSEKAQFIRDTSDSDDDSDYAERWEKAAREIRKFNDSRNFKESVLQEPSQINNTLLLMAEEMSSGVTYHSSDRQHFSPELIPEADKNFAQARQLFSDVGKRVFTDVPATAGMVALLRNIRQRTSQIENPVLDSWVRHFREDFNIDEAVKMKDSDPAALLKEIEHEIWAMGTDLNTASLTDTSPQTQKDIAEMSRAMYVLELVRQDLEKRIETSQAKPQEKPTEQAEGVELNFAQESFKRLEGATTVEDVRAVLTPEMIQQARSHALHEIDGAIAQAERLIEAEEKVEGQQSIINKKTTTNVFGTGMQGSVGAVYQKIGALKFGKVMSLDQIAKMPIVDFMRTFFDYDLANDPARAQKLEKYTNVFDE